MFKSLEKAFVFFCLSLSLAACTSGPAPSRPQEVTALQDARVYLTDLAQPWVILPSYQKITLADYKRHYYAPWTQAPNPKYYALPGERLNIKAYENYQLTTFSQHHFWDQHYQPYSPGWTKTLSVNVDLASFPNTVQPAIALQNTALRILPSAQRVYENPNRAGQGYPFDDFQVDNVWAGTPLQIVHLSTDKKWALVKTPDMVGWVLRSDIAPVTKPVMQIWRTHAWVGAQQDNVAVTLQGKTIFKAKIGAPYPVVGSSNNSYDILIPVLGLNGYAVLQTAQLAKANSAAWPVAATKTNFANLLNNLQGHPYLWGGLKQGRDCSATIRDLLANFGVWMPRSSGDQIATGKPISLKRLSPKAKQQYIATHAKPFATLIGYPGHVTLFVGNYQGTPYIFQNAWGLKTYTIFGEEGRAVIGRTVISPLDLGSDEFLTKSLLTKPLTMTYIVPPLQRQHEIIE